MADETETGSLAGRRSDWLIGLGLAALWVAAGVVMLALWTSHGRYKATGDEPSYMIMADGLARYGSLEQSRPVQDEFATNRFDSFGHPPPGTALSLENAHTLKGPHGFYSVHNPGLPVLLAPAVGLGGGFAAKAMMVLLTCLIPVGAWRCSGLFTRRIDLRIASVLALTFGLPFLPASQQVFPDLLSGGLALNVLVTLMEADHRRKLGWPDLLTASLAVALLPWLHVKNAAPALLLAIGLAWTGVRSIGLAGLTGCLPLLASLAGLGAYNAWAFGDPLGPYEDGALQAGAPALTAFLGLHFDRMQGVFVQNPLFLLAPLFLLPFLRTRPATGALMLAVHAAFILPNAMHPDWYGGVSFAGRFMWAAASAILPAAMFGLVRIAERLPRPGWIALIAAFLALQGAMWIGYSTVVSLMHDASPAGRAMSVMPPLARILPGFDPTAPAIAQLAIFSAVLAGLVLLGLLAPIRKLAASP